MLTKSTQMTLVLATNNQGKIKEFQTLFDTSHIDLVPQASFEITSPNETGLSFVENALIKARHASQHSHLPALADDSGLVVPALQGKPGIYSARFAGEHATDAENIVHLLHCMEQLNQDQRTAYFYCAIVAVNYPSDPIPIIATGMCHGLIQTSSEGTFGFGYDPIFYLPEHQCTMAQLPPEIKNTLSHRAQALNKFKQIWSQVDHDYMV